MSGILYVLPNVLAAGRTETLSAESLRMIKKLRHFAVENVKMTRRAIRSFDIATDFNECTFYDIHHKNDPVELNRAISRAINQLQSGEDVGIMSDAGMAGIADPGSGLIAQAHTKDIQVKPLVGPSSILLALIASGFNGQSFKFHGYLPIEGRNRKDHLKRIQAEVQSTSVTQIFMETPYRNNQLLEAIINTVSHKTKLCIACNITSEEEFIHTKTVGEWKQTSVDLHKKPAVFLMGK